MNEMVENILKSKGIIFLFFTLTLIASYFGFAGYYMVYGIDIASYLSIQDITLIFARWTWLVIFYIALFFYSVCYITDWLKDETTWINRTIGQIKWLSPPEVRYKDLLYLMLIIVFFVFLFIMYMNKDVMDITFNIMKYSSLLIIIWAFVIVTLTHFNRQKTRKREILKSWFYFTISVVFFIAFIPFIIGGTIASERINQTEMKIKLEDKTLLSISPDSKLNYVGRTADYFFIYNNEKGYSIVYRNDKIQSIQVNASR